MQRLIVVFVSVVLYALGALVGDGQGWPILNGVEITPQHILQTGGQIGLPALLGVYLIWQMLQEVNRRVQDGSIDAGNIVHLLKMQEFWVFAVGAAAAALQVFGFVWLENPDTQAILVTVALGAVALLFRSYDQRLPGKPAPPENNTTISGHYG